jgi:hypothetical protein
MTELGNNNRYPILKNGVGKIGTFREMHHEARELPQVLDESKKFVPSEVVMAYEEFKPRIEDVFGNTSVNPDLLHHGTGAIRYEGEKYGSGIVSQIQRPLDNILTEGLTPQLDIFSFKGPMMSTSLAYSWEYAKWYATMCQDPQNPLVWEYGNRDNWGSYFLTNTIKAEMKLANAPYIAKAFGSKIAEKVRKQPEELNRMQKWASSASKDVDSATSLKKILKLRTDIAGNFGGIITVKKTDAPAVNMGPGDEFERRTLASIKPTDFVALSVPLNEVNSYQNVVSALGLPLPVLPIETIDYHLCKFPVSQVIRPR